MVGGKSFLILWPNLKKKKADLIAMRYGSVWMAIACNYLAIMASSVSSKHAFLSATLTITKHWNHLKGDIVEALQVMKSLLHQELVFCETGPSSTTKNLCEKHDEELLNAELDGLEFWYLM